MLTFPLLCHKPNLCSGSLCCKCEPQYSKRSLAIYLDSHTCVHTHTRFCADVFLDFEVPHLTGLSLFCLVSASHLLLNFHFFLIFMCMYVYVCMVHIYSGGKIIIHSLYHQKTENQNLYVFVLGFSPRLSRVEKRGKLLYKNML